MSHSGTNLTARTLVAGSAEGATLFLDEPLSLWGGMDIASGNIIDQHHPQVGQCLTGRVVVMPAARGSSSSGSVIAEAIYAGTAPAAIVLNAPDAILTFGALVAAELYGIDCPIVVAAEPLARTKRIRIEAGEEIATITYL